MIRRLRFPAALVLFFAALMTTASAQAPTATIEGQVQDPSGAVIPGAAVTLTEGAQTKQTTSGADGHYAFRALAAGSYNVTATATGFAPLVLPSVAVTDGQRKQLNLPLTIAVEQQDVTVEAQSQSVGLSADQNTNAVVIKGDALNALSDDPDELQSELQALAGPAAGPNGGQIYIDGFEGGQIPPKSSILEVRVNQNPFSAEYDRMGYGRIEIITKPGGQKLKGNINSYGDDSALNTANPFLAGKPPYYLFGVFGDVSGPFTKTSTWFMHAQRNTNQGQAIVNAVDPNNTSGSIHESLPIVNTYMSLGPRVDFQLGKNHNITVRDNFYRLTNSGSGVGTLNLPSLATNSTSAFEELIAGDTWVISPKLLSELRVFWDRTRTESTPATFTPTITVQGAFTEGGSGSGTSANHADLITVQDYFTTTAGDHGVRFGVRFRTTHDTNESTAGENGSYSFNNVASYLAQTPAQYQATVITNPVVRATVFDASGFVQDDWRLSTRVQLGLGLRYEAQNIISDHSDLAPRIALAWSPNKPSKTPPKTVVRMGYGWFYTRFTGPNAFNGGAATPYVIETLHDNLVNQKSYVLTNPAFYNPNAAAPPSALTGSSAVPSYHTIDAHFHAALDMQAGIGVDRQIAKHVTGNVTYLYTQGAHQYLLNNVTAPSFDVADYTITGATPSVFNYQYQSGGFYRQNQLIASASLQLKKLTVTGNYTYSDAKSDTQGVNSSPSVSANPGLDYGRAAFGLTNRVLILESLTLPHGVVFASLFNAQSGTPYNLTIGNDLTGNNQFNARPTFGTCGATGVVTTQYGCLDTNPTGKNEAIVPYDLGTGPVNAVMHVRVSKVFGIGPKIKAAGNGQTFTPGGGGVGGRGIGSGGPALRLDAAAPRRFNLTMAAGINNIFNMVNLAPRNGVLLSPLFNQYQSVATGPFGGGGQTGTRTVFLQAGFSF